MPHKGHTHLAAGFYDGSVAIWELTSDSCLLRTGTVDSCTIFPYQLFVAHHRLVSSIVWSPSNRFLQNGMLYVDFGFLGFKPHLVPAQSASVWTVSVCNWTNILYMGDGAGSVVGTMLPNCWKEQSLYQHYIFPVYWMEKNDASRWEEADETEKFSSIWQVHEGNEGQECGEKPSEFGLTFHDTDLTSFFKHRVRDSFKRLSDQRKYESSQLDDARLKPHFSIHKVRSNPCLDSHLWLLSAGFSGLCFHGQAYKHHVLWNILVALGTCGGQLVFSGATFSCPCKAGLNIPYSMATLVVPSLLLFLLGCGLCADTWHLLRACTHGQLSSNTWDIVGSILLSVIGRAIVAPLSWTCISLLTGTMFVCAAAESSDPTQYGFYDLFVTWKSLPEIMAAVPCPDIPLDPALQKAHFPRQAVLLSLHAKSQMYGWLLLGLCSIFIFGVMCVKDHNFKPIFTKRHHTVEFIITKKPTGF
uniref:Uncharacterized protein n=1 Tax=Eptatretus burgeri TaxID=7764 RepID=A0A8C4WZ04_EPTBU